MKMRTTFTEVHNLDWRRLLVGVVAVSVVFLGTALWVTFSASNSGIGLGAIVTSTLSNPVFWALSIVAFAVCHRLAA
jgi:uncharacterized membrane protein